MNGRILIIKHMETEGGGLIESLLAADGWELDIVELERGTSLPGTLDDVSAIISLGGAMNAYEEESYPFLRDEDRLIKTALQEEIPFLGVCLGAQLLAKACDAKVYPAPEKETGWYTATLTPDARRDLVFAGAPTEFPVFQWHGDTFDIPERGVLCAVGETCRNQAFRVGHYAYGLQFHIEATPDMIGDWMRDEAGIDSGRIALDTKRLGPSCARVAETVIMNFMRLVQSAARVRQVMRVHVNSQRKARAAYWWNPEIRMLIPEKGVA